MNSHIKLQEIIWEVTDHCKNNCDYCGSKDDLNQTELDEDKIMSIAESIATYPPMEINISGGDPLLLSDSCTSFVCDTLRAAGIKVKVIMNPLSYFGTKGRVEMYDWIGLSINTLNELKAAEIMLKTYAKHNFTVISNFSEKNLFDYEKIEAFVLKHQVGWQVQYTMCDEGAIYDNPESKAYFFSKIDKSLMKNYPLICADNLNAGPCSAGIGSVGILANGDVVPCLSMRSWSPSMYIQGNLFRKNLKDIWENEFKKQRFCEFDCCKDICKAPFMSKQDMTKDLLKTFPPTPIKKIDRSSWPKPDKGMTMVYGVQDFAVMYGVGMPPITNQSLTASGLEKY